ncbi:protein of unknown function [Taphrina deformans PYCC 5710]|uniref:DNA repair protein rad5 n=1 Tax=Taphrina deformans (strain PYCC 5710 / ATCC 11124 / CBS 356.35 / IMI 108563 / JCM 9778 / NBRC 8474) TaxID=1097556 RepID=R4XMA4_TAPDE|nr:protein of unknown function [Taphrina deformans PYCC 5710]|eukprot:CCG84430.1 protein of unknown function [Taphrina deformans PYCC 5710]
MMSLTSDGPPFKKRRFLAEPIVKVDPVIPQFAVQFREFVGEDVESATIVALRDLTNGSVEQAVNMWYDGSWKQSEKGRAILGGDDKPSSPMSTTSALTTPQTPVESDKTSSTSPDRLTSAAKNIGAVVPQWKRRYLGSFGTQGYLTSSTSLHADQKLKITRQNSPSIVKNKSNGKISSKPMVNRPGPDPRAKANYITRFCLPNGTEVGRLEQESAIIVSTLMDLEICFFEATVIFAPERPRVGSNVDLMVSCYMRKNAMQLKPSPAADHDSLDNSTESAEERILKLRRFSLVKLFDLIGLKACRGSESSKEVAQMAEASIESPPVKTTTKTSGSDDETEEGEELQADQLDTLYSKAQTFDHNMPMMEPADTFQFTLKPYQKQALHWMVNKERHTAEDARKVESMHPLWQEYKFPTEPDDSSEACFYMNPYSGEMSMSFPHALDECRGGILADEMGLGKTIEILSLVHTAKLERGDVDNTPLNTNEMLGSATQSCHTTLVVAPLTLIQQWHSEAENASKVGSLKTLLYYGAEKAANIARLCSGPNAANAPDLVITSYGVVLSEYTKYLETGKPSGLFAVDFYRVVLDEAHTIKNRQAKTSRACYNIKANKRWALTGTPIVNKLEDLYSLVHYLGVEPWGVYSFWRTFITLPFESKEYIKALDVVQTVLEPLVLRRTKDMKDIDGKPIVDLPSKTIEMVHLDLSENERDVYNFISARARREYNQNAMAGTVMKNYTYILSMILRLRQSCCDPTLVKQKVDQSELTSAEDGIDAKEIPEEDPLQDVDLSELISKFQTDAASGEKEATSYGESVLQQIREGAEKECPICTEEPIEDQTVTKCFHMACKNCLLEHIKFQESRGEEPLCHTCRQPVAIQDLLEVVRHAPAEEGGSEQIFLRPAQRTLGSTKIDRLVKSLHETRRIDPRIKSVVFSQFTSFLDIIQLSLKRQKLPFLRLDGAMSQKDRAAVLEKFRDTPGNMTFIISLKAGGVGLNLTNAHHVYMLDPWWSFAIESQAIDRIHRMGQTREVRVFRYIVRNSVEEKMLKIQERKNFLASSLGMSKEEKKRETLKDIQTLFED